MSIAPEILAITSAVALFVLVTLNSITAVRAIFTISRASIITDIKFFFMLVSHLLYSKLDISLYILISTRLFFALPSSVELSAIGTYSPLPEVLMRAGSRFVVSII